MKTLSKAAITVILLASMGAAQDQSDVIRARENITTLQSMMRDPDSFVLEAVYLKPNRKNGPNICYYYRSRNGFGGMTKGVAVLKNNNRLTDLTDIAGGVYGYCTPKKSIDITSQVVEPSR